MSATRSSRRGAPGAGRSACGQPGCPSEIAAAVGRGNAALVALAGALGPAGPAREWLCSLRHFRLAINGDDLLEAGVSAGPAIGRGLRAATAAALDGRAAGREAQLRAALAAATPGERGAR